MKSSLIAPCGMNCNLCRAYLREKQPCPGCKVINKDKPKTRQGCFIKNCKILKDKNLKYCSVKCENYPCQKLTNLDKRYKTKYTMSMIDNLEFIREKGIKKFIQNETKRWIKGNKIFCIHKQKYFDLK